MKKLLAILILMGICYGVVLAVEEPEEEIKPLGIEAVYVNSGRFNFGNQIDATDSNALTSGIYIIKVIAYKQSDLTETVLSSSTFHLDEIQKDTDIAGTSVSIYNVIHGKVK